MIFDSVPLVEGQGEFIERSRSSSCRYPTMWRVVTIRKLSTLDSPIAFRHQRHGAFDLSPRRETIREDFTDPKKRRNSSSTWITSTRAPYIFFRPTNVFTIKKSKRRSRSSLDRAMNRNDPLAFDRRDLYCLTQKAMDLKPLEKPFGMICVSRGTWMCNGPKFTTVVWQDSCNFDVSWRFPQSSLDY